VAPRGYSFFTVRKFTGYNEQELVSATQASLHGFGTNPRTEMKLETKEYFRGLDHLLCNHEVQDKRPHRWGDDIPYDRSTVAAPIAPYDIYYQAGADFLIFRGPRHAGRGAFRRLAQRFPEAVSVEEGRVDFAYVLEHIKGDVAGSWFTGLQGRVKSAGMFGDNVRLDPDFEKYGPETMSALYLDLVVEGRRSTLQVIITANRSVVIQDDLTPEEDLDFLLAVKPLLFGGTPPPKPNRRLVVAD